MQQVCERLESSLSFRRTGFFGWVAVALMHAAMTLSAAAVQSPSDDTVQVTFSVRLEKDLL
ncbi:MAG: hypothetical protein ACKN9U_20935, partial [Pirellulaceae bacterium]